MQTGRLASETNLLPIRNAPEEAHTTSNRFETYERSAELLNARSIISNYEPLLARNVYLTKDKFDT